MTTSIGADEAGVAWRAVDEGGFVIRQRAACCVLRERSSHARKS
jgi:hypothetical protein